MTSLAARLSTRLGGGDALRPMFPGFAVSVLVAVTAQFLSDRYGAPAMLLALLLGLALNFLADEGTRTGRGSASRCWRRLAGRPSRWSWRG